MSTRESANQKSPPIVVWRDSNILRQSRSIMRGSSPTSWRFSSFSTIALFAPVGHMPTSPSSVWTSTTETPWRAGVATVESQKRSVAGPRSQLSTRTSVIFTALLLLRRPAYQGWPPHRLQRLRQRLGGDRHAGESNRQRAGHGREPPEGPGADLDPLEQAPGVDQREPEPDQHGRQPDAEGDHEEHAESNAAERDGAEQHDERGGAWKEPARHAQREQTAQRHPAGRRRVRVAMVRVPVVVVVMNVAVVVVGMVVVAMAVMVVRRAAGECRPRPTHEQPGAQPDHQQTRPHLEEGVEPLGQDELRK